MADLFKKRWEEGLKYHNSNPEKALDHYLKAVKVLKNNCKDPYIFADIAECYYFLENFNNCEKYYNLAETNNLISTPSRRSEYSYNNFAKYLCNVKKDYEKAYTYILKAMETLPENQVFLDTLIRILFATEKTEEALETLVKLYKINKDCKHSIDLFVKYKNEIENKIYIEKKTKNDAIVLSLFKNIKTNENTINYILGIHNDLSLLSNSLIQNTEFMLEQLFNQFSTIDNEYSERIYKIAIHFERHFEVVKFLKCHLNKNINNDLIKDVFIECVLKFFEESKKLTKGVNEYLKNNAVEDFNISVSSFSISYSFYTIYLHNNNLEQTHPFFIKLFNLSLIFDRDLTLTKFFANVFENSVKRYSYIEDISNKYKIPFDMIFVFLTNKSEKGHKWAFEYLNIILDYKFSESFQLLKTLEKKLIMYLLPVFVKNNKNKTYDYLIELQSSNLKQLKDKSKELLSTLETLE